MEGHRRYQARAASENRRKNDRLSGLTGNCGCDAAASANAFDGRSTVPTLFLRIHVQL